MSDVMNLNEQTLYLRNKELEAEVTELLALLRDAVHRIGTEGFDAKWQEAAKEILEVKT